MPDPTQPTHNADVDAVLANPQPVELCDSPEFKIAVRIVAECIVTGDMRFADTEAADQYAVTANIARIIKAMIPVIDTVQLLRR